MKITKEENSWSPEFWQASGSLGIDLDGLDIEGRAAAAYYRAGTEVPESTLTIPVMGSETGETRIMSNYSESASETQPNIFDNDTIFTSGSFAVSVGEDSQSVFSGEISLDIMKTTKVGDKWSPEYWQASGSIGIDLSGLDLTGTATAAFYRAGKRLTSMQKKQIYLQTFKSKIHTLRTQYLPKGCLRLMQEASSRAPLSCYQ